MGGGHESSSGGSAMSIAQTHPKKELLDLVFHRDKDKWSYKDSWNLPALLIVLLIKTLAVINDSTLVGGNTQVDGDTEVEPSALPPLVDLIINIDDFLKIQLASFLEEMTADKYRNFCLSVVEACDTITTSDNKLSCGFKRFDDNPCSFLKKVQKKSAEFKELLHNHCKPLSAILTTPELNLLCVFPLVFQGELCMHADRTTSYGIPS